MEFIRKIKHKKRVNRLISEAVLQQIEVMGPLNEEKSLQAIGLPNEFDKYYSAWKRLEMRIDSLDELERRGPKDRFIRDNGKIRNCPSNVAKMTLLEVIMHAFSPKSLLIGYIEAFKTAAESIAAIVITTTFPIWGVFWVINTRERARLEVDKCNKSRRAQRRRA